MAAQLHRRAAAWLESQGDYVAAIGQLTSARDWVGIGRLIIERAAPDLVAAQGGALVDALEPAARRSRVEPTPATLLASALWNFRRFDYDAMLRDTNSAALAAAASPRPDPRTAPAGSPTGIDVLVAVLRMAYARARDPRSLVATAGEALATHRPGAPSSSARGGAVPGDRRGEPGYRPALGGDLTAATATLTAGEKSCHEWDLSLPELTAAGHLAIIEAVHGRFRQAVRDGERARMVAERHGWSPEPQASAHMVALAWAALAGGRLDIADRLIAAVIGRGNPDTGCQSALAVLSIEVALTRRDHGWPPGGWPTWMPSAPGQGIATHAGGLCPARGGGRPAGPRRPGRRATAAAGRARHRLQRRPAHGRAREVPARPGRCRRVPGIADPSTARLDPFAAPAVDGRLVASLAAARLGRTPSR